MTEREQWIAIFDNAESLKQSFGTLAPAFNVKGRWIKYLLDKMIEFWNDHQATLIPFLSSLAVAAFNSLIFAKPSVDGINQPGPQ